MKRATTRAGNPGIQTTLLSRNGALPQTIVGLFVTLLFAPLAAACDDTAADGPLKSDPAADTSIDAAALQQDTAANPGSGLLFAQEGASSGARIALEAAATAPDTFEVQVVLRDFKDLFGVAGHLRYDPAQLELTKLSTDSILEGGDYYARSVGVDSPKGRVLLGSTRYFVIGESPFQALEGIDFPKRTWAKLTFRIKLAGTHTIAFDPDSTVAKQSTYEDHAASWHKLIVTATEVGQ